MMMLILQCSPRIETQDYTIVLKLHCSLAFPLLVVVELVILEDLGDRLTLTGHTTVGILMRHYAKAVEGKQRAAVEGLFG